MRIALKQPTPTSLVSVAETLAQWQAEPWQGQLHPGDLGWKSMAGAERTAAALRLWSRDGEAVAVGMLDGPNLLRVALAPAARQDAELGARIAADLDDPARGVLPAGEAAVEARGAHAVTEALHDRGWNDDEPWTPFTMELSRPSGRPAAPCELRVERAELRDVDDWIAVHWSAFKGTPLDDASRARLRERWLTMMTGPFAPMARSLTGYDAAGTPVAVTTVWSLGAGRPGLIEPMGVHADHRSRGYGVAITQAGALALRAEGASSVVLAAENSNAAALRTYLAAGFRAAEPVRDVVRSA